MRAVLRRFILLFPGVLILLSVMSCTSDEGSNSSDSPKMAFAVPSKISSLQINPDSLRAYLIVDGGQRQAMTISGDGSSAQTSVTLKVGVHTFKIEFDYEYMAGTTAKSAMLADASLSLDVKTGTNPLNFTDEDFSYDHFCDSDGSTNIFEISRGSDPCDGNSIPVSGVWSLTNNPPKPDPIYSNSLCSLGTFNPKLSVSQDIFNLTAVDGTGVQFDSGTLQNAGIFSLNGSKSWVGLNGDTVAIDVQITGQFNASDNITVAMQRTASVADVEVCSESADYVGEVIYQFSGGNYSQLYGVEVRGIDMVSAELARSNAPLEIAIQGDTMNMYIGQDQDIFTGSFNASNGSFSVNSIVEEIVNEDGDVVANDLIYRVERIDGLFIGPAVSVGGTANLVGLYYGDRALFLNTDTYDPLATPDSVQQDAGHFYGKDIATTTSTATVLSPGDDLNPANSQKYLLRLNNPPLKRTVANSTLSMQVVDPNSTVICSAFYQNGFREIVDLPYKDYKSEQFQDGVYSYIDCAPSTLSLNTTSNYYMVNILEQGSIINSFPLTATPAAVFPSQIPNYKNVNINGALASQTQLADPLPLHGYFNPTQDLPVILPTSGNNDAELALDNYQIYMRRQREPGVLFRVASTDVNAILPQDVIREADQREDKIELWLVEDLVDGFGAIAQAESRSLELQPGVRGLFNFELVDDVTDNPDYIPQMYFDEFQTAQGQVRCYVTRPYSINTSLSCNSAVFDYASNTLTATITDSSVFPPEVTDFTAEFTDSVNAAASTDSVLYGSTSGDGKIVNTELFGRAVVRHDDLVIYPLDLQNPNPLFTRGTLQSAIGQDLDFLVDGTQNTLIMWDDNNADAADDFVAVYGSREILPLDDRIPQTVLTGIPYRSPGKPAISDTLNFILDNNINDGTLVDTYSVYYDASLDPHDLFLAGSLPPSRTDFEINGVPVIDTKGTINDPIVVNAGNPIIVTWADTTRTDNRSDLRWRIQASNTNPDYNHENLMSQWMGQSNANLTFSSGFVSWIAPPHFTEYLFDDLSFAQIAQIGVRIKNTADTLRGASQSVYFSVQPVSGNQVPVVSAGDNFSVSGGGGVGVFADANDIDGTISSYLWQQMAGEQVILNNADTELVDFTTPTVATTITLRVTVTDNGGEAASDEVDITVTVP